MLELPAAPIRRLRPFTASITSTAWFPSTRVATITRTSTNTFPSTSTSSAFDDHAAFEHFFRSPTCRALPWVSAVGATPSRVPPYS